MSLVIDSYNCRQKHLGAERTSVYKAASPPSSKKLLTTSLLPSKPSSLPVGSVAAQSADQQPARKSHLARAEANWVAFPPLPEAALHPFSSAVQFVSTTLKPLTEPSIAYPSGPLPNHLSRANTLLSSSSSASSSSSSSALNHLHSASHLSHGNSNGALKRSRTTTSSTHPTSISRKRSKSDFGSTSYRPAGSSQQPPIHPNIRPLVPSRKTQDFGSSSSLAHLNAPRSTRQRSRTPDPHTPALLIRQKQRLSEPARQASGPRKSSNSSPYPQYMSPAVRSSSSLKSSASVSSIGTLYPSRSRAHSQLNPIVSGVQDEDCPVGPVRRTYLGGVGVYLNNPQDEEDPNSMDDEDDDSPGGSPDGLQKTKPQLTINVGLCKNPSESAKSSANWYNRLLLSPLSSAGSSVYSFIMNGSSPLVPSDHHPDHSLELEHSPAQEPLRPAPSDSITASSWKHSFRRQKSLD
ncbi:hypothetical protein PGTUg99_030051 [Puccinia graminis f. sp. tritici]|uniref:Uncharacterized protein n=1 Tax=Puccinia graminis f. sp. tritici TaxID=56615 RepID=A0A5B0S210_PUCGR|nr:hypothetical protein PGTUg99_030051 [Puccinia graminis f. sp. tritici]